MKDQVITYRGAETTLNELNKDLQAHHHYAIQYRGQHGDVEFGAHPKKQRTITYRGAKAEMMV